MTSCSSFLWLTFHKSTKEEPADPGFLFLQSLKFGVFPSVQVEVQASNDAASNFGFLQLSLWPEHREGMVTAEWFGENPVPGFQRKGREPYQPLAPEQDPGSLTLSCN